ncbi:MAG: hypothetical protein ACNS60_00515 [Candidatus Cyclobacteriaceae bacterium M2_1C_046]
MKPLIRKLPLLIYFTYQFNKVTLGFTLFFTLISLGYAKNILLTFTILFLTAGFGLAFVISLLREDDKLYFYLNKGFNKYELFAGAYLISLIILLIFNIILRPLL